MIKSKYSTVKNGYEVSERTKDIIKNYLNKKSENHE
jgi:hypothetical protein